MIREMFDMKIAKYIIRFKSGDKEIERAYYALASYYRGDQNFDSLVCMMAQKADCENRPKLKLAFPHIVELWELCDCAGMEEWYDLKGFMGLFNE